MAAIDMDVDADVDAEPADESMDHKHAGPSVEDDSHVQDFEYFSQHGIKHATSNRTLSDLRMPSDKERHELLQKTVEKNSTGKKFLRNHYEEHFRQWFVQLKAGFNILCYGVGSKKQLLQNFAKQWLRDGPVVVVNGYFPGVALKQVLGKIITDVLNHQGSFRDVLAQITFIKSVLASEHCPCKHIYILIHNIDGQALRKEQVQESLSLLACVPGVHMIASIDHILAPLLWDAARLSRFNWIWRDVTSYQRYESELVYDTAVAGSSAASRARGIKYVLQSLTPNHREILSVLAQRLLEPAGPEGLDFQEYFALCQESMLVSSDVSFRSHLRELIDHELIMVRRLDGRALYTIPHSHDVIREQVLKKDGAQA